MESLARSLLYRYWFFEWLFRDASRGTLLERQAALRYNRERAAWLPLYIRRWSCLAAGLFLVGSGLESADLVGLAAFVFLLAIVSTPVIAVAAAGWLILGRHSSSKHW